MNQRAKQPSSAIPIACNLDSRGRARKGDEIAQLVESARRLEGLDDGVAFELAGDEVSAARVLEFVRAERLCCPFFTFELAFEPDQGPVRLRLRGSAKAKTFIESYAAGLGGRE